ncbi:thymus-specific serine protease [Antennarius striatus]|uniref:thymus-specific serine protease n=1 Tax=Antennarius striatus TaxID=241820 RepID=UPI0035ADCAEA
MIVSPAHVLLLLFLFRFVHAGRVLTDIRERVRDLQLQDARRRLASSRRRLQHVKEGRIRQRLDHFNRQNTDTLLQRFFMNDAFWENPDGPVFLFIGGEGPVSEIDVLTGHHVDMAEEHGALLLALEHRFYGDSINPDGLRTENLIALSSQQALADLAEFHQFISRGLNLTLRNPWISFGGSYSGALSAWFRGKFPHLIFAAVASSAPIRAQLDFSAYCKAVGLSLMNEAVGGSQKCLTGVQDAFAALEAALLGGNSSQVSADFSCCQTPQHPEDQIELIQSVADIVMATVQYNEEGAFLSIREVCDVMTDATRQPYPRLVRLGQLYRSTTGGRCVNVSHEAAVRDLMDTSVPPRRSERQWIYQTCTEFGFYQTCEDTTCPFSRRLTLQVQTEICSTLFGISQHSLQGRVAFTNTYYGGDDPPPHRVLYVNGGVDPWRELSVIRDRTEGGEPAQIVFIQDAAHCADMRTRVTDRRSLENARNEIKTRVSGWLETAKRSL